MGTMAIGSHLKAYRESCGGLSYQEAAARASIAAGTWQNYERGYYYAPDGRRMDTTYTRRTILKIARTIGQPPAVLLVAAGLPASEDDAGPLQVVENVDPREELTDLLVELSDTQAWSLLYVAQSMLDAQAQVPASYQGSRVLVREAPAVRELSAEERAARQRSTSEESPPGDPNTT